MSLPKYPSFVQPVVPQQIQDLESDSSGIISVIRGFLEGKYDPTAEMFTQYLDANQYRSNKAADTLRKNIIASQGAQRVYGGAAGQQLNQALIDKVKDDLDREQDFLWDTLNQVVNNRKFGVQSGQDTISSARQYAIQKANMENNYNQGVWQSQVAQKQYRDANTNNIGAYLKPAITQSLSSSMQTSNLLPMIAQLLA